MQSGTSRKKNAELKSHRSGSSPARRASNRKRTRNILALAAAVETFGSLLASYALATTTTYTLNASDPGNTSSFTNPILGNPPGWSSGAAPVAGTGGNLNYYEVAGPYRLRTPQDANTYTFAGDNLKIDGSGVLFIKSQGGTIIANSLELNGGAIDLSNTGGPSGFTSTLAGNITLDPLTVSFFGSESNQTLVVSSVISGGGGVQVNGSATYGGNGISAISNIFFSNSNTYSGATTISAGTLRANNGTGNGSATGSGNIIVAAGTSAYGGGRLGGNGALTGTVTLSSSATAKDGGVIAAGGDDSTTGLLSTGNATWSGGTAYTWKINSLGSTAGVGSGGSSASPGTTSTWDDVSMGTLDVSSAGGSNQPITIAPHNTAALTGASTYSWIIAQTTGAVTLPGTGYNIGVGNNLLTEAVSTGSNTLFALDTSGFSGGFSINGSTPSNTSSAFSLELVGNGGGGDNLVLDYNATPEPASTLLVVVGAVPVLALRKRQRKVLA